MLKILGTFTFPLKKFRQVYSAKALGASDRNAELIAIGVDISTIFLGGTNGIKNIKNIFSTNNLTNFEKISTLGGEATKVKSGWKVLREGGSSEAMKVYKELLKSGYKSEALKGGNGYRLTKGIEEIIFRSSNSRGYKNLDVFNKKINGKEVNVHFKE